MGDILIGKFFPCNGSSIYLANISLVSAINSLSTLRYQLALHNQGTLDKHLLFPSMNSHFSEDRRLNELQ